MRPEFNGLVKVDVDAGSHTAWDPEPGRHANEALFVPDPENPDGGEDEGWLLSYVYDARQDTSDLVVLDATDVAGGPVAEVELPQRVPYGFHGTWVPA